MNGLSWFAFSGTVLFAFLSILCGRPDARETWIPHSGYLWNAVIALFILELSK